VPTSQTAAAVCTRIWRPKVKGLQQLGSIVGDRYVSST